MILNKTDISVTTYNTIALRGVVVFPKITTSFEIGRKSSVKTFRDALEREEHIFLVAQKDTSVVEPSHKDLVKVGVVAVIKHALKLPNGNYSILVEGLYRGERHNSYYDNNILKSDVVIVDDSTDESRMQEEAVLINETLSIFNEYIKYISNPSPEVISEAMTIKSASFLADFLASAFLFNFEDRLVIIEEKDPFARLEKLNKLFIKDVQLLQLEGTIQTKVKYRLQKSQR